ncbi:hemophilus-specific protein [Muribacter muris]|uniref:Hemophilus-specific protein n=1 Tax=Muribacter muris TaxID=67855 RepID=A0A4Y9JTH0_9PAST|nr:hemophilus-specific protein [Muribacter muris]MBF0786134.1 hemophilus-specific protein [Muribacter muris]MBF0827345.1 hemophilus-specific protein [Muribacter muris]TFV07807.1 hemophilus-specific protein [Muribacter muris]
MIHIRLSCLADILDPKNIHSQDHIAKQIEANALYAWQNRHTSESSVRFINKMGDGFFRFLNVKQQPDGSLLVYRN